MVTDMDRLAVVLVMITLWFSVLAMVFLRRIETMEREIEKLRGRRFE